MAADKYRGAARSSAQPPPPIDYDAPGPGRGASFSSHTRARALRLLRTTQSEVRLHGKATEPVARTPEYPPQRLGRRPASCCPNFFRRNQAVHVRNLT